MAYTVPGINIDHRRALALEQFKDASALIMQGNMLVGVVDDTGDGYLAVPINIRAIARYEKGSAHEEKAYAARFPEEHRFAPYQELLETWLESDGYDCIPPTLEAVNDQLARSASEPGIMLIDTISRGRISQTWVDKKPASHQRMMQARANLLKSGDSESKLVTFERSIVGFWDYNTLWMLYRHSKDLVIRLPLDSRSMEAIARSLLESPLTFQRWQETFDSAEKMEWSPGRGPIHYWLLSALGVRPKINAETVAIAGIYLPTPEWVQRAIAADPETYPSNSGSIADVDDQFIQTSIANKKSFISQVNTPLGN